MDDITLEPIIGCTLRLLSEDHVPSLFRTIDENRSRLGEWLGWVDQVRKPDDIRNFVDRGREDARERRAFNFGVFLDDDLAGVASLRVIHREHRTASIGYWIGRDFTGRGLAMRAAGALIDFGVGPLELDRIEIRCALGNVNSQRIPQALGFVMEGTARGAARVGERILDEYVYARVRGEPPRL